VHQRTIGGSTGCASVGWFSAEPSPSAREIDNEQQEKDVRRMKEDTIGNERTVRGWEWSLSLAYGNNKQ